MLAIMVRVIFLTLLSKSFSVIESFTPRDFIDSKEGDTCIEGGGEIAREKEEWMREIDRD